MTSRGSEPIMSSHPNAPQGKHDISEVQSALFDLHEGLMSLKASLLELARTHEEEIAMQHARVETEALMARLRHQF